MNTLLVSFVLIHAVWLLGYAAYRLLAGRDTFFRLRRTLLLGLSLAAVAFPLLSQWEGLPVTTDGALPEALATRWLPAVVVGARSGGGQWFHGLACVYFGVSLLRLLRLAMQAVATLRYIRRCPVVRTADGLTCRVLPEGTQPFSFFHSLCLPEEVLTSPRREAIVRHEQVHMRQGHSGDIVWMLLQCALLWPNPCVWLAFRELRKLHEFEADREALSASVNRQDYQLALLVQSRHSVATNLCNNFNVSPLKERIHMMNKTRTRRAAALKYALLAPVAAALLVCGGTLRAAATEALPSAAMPQSVVKKAQAKATPSAVRRAAYKSPQKAKANGTVKPRKGDVLPQYPGGNIAMQRFIAENLHYPKAALDANAEGMVTVFFTVTAEGKACNFKAGDPRTSNHGMNAEALRVVSLLKDKQFTPGRQNGKAVDMQMVLPVHFKLQ